MSAVALAPEASSLIALPPQVVLPEPVANREEPVAAATLAAWLGQIISQDRDGYVLLSSSGQTMVVLYADGRLVETAQTRGGNASGARALHALLESEHGEWFAVSHPLKPDLARCLAGLFAPPASLSPLTLAGGSLETVLARLQRQQFSGALRLMVTEGLAVVVLIAGGTPLASYSTDERILKSDLADITFLAAFDDLSIALHPAPTRDLASVLDAARLAEPANLTGGDGRDALIVESLLIEAFSTLEYEISVAEISAPTLEHLSMALAGAYGLLADAQIVIGRPSAERAPNDPLIIPFWNETQRQLDTTRLLTTFRRVGVPNVWWVAAKALIEIIQQRVVQQLGWLAEADPAAADTLAEAAEDIFQRAQALTGR
ncbi:MAG TPA: hypothetical protein VEX37_04045 [Thermomicrobiales bacterium]|nr:hypothetical protein [Thermomicrobiales bacterium]